MISALVTLFNPKQNNVDNINRIARQSDRVFVCDNSSVDNSALFAESAPNIVYIANKKNLGLPAAFNKVFKGDYWETADQDNDDQWIIFFDQDSKIESGHINSLINEFKKIREKNDIGCLGPLYYEINSSQIQIPKSKYRITEHSYAVKSIITSSMLTTLDIIKEVGYWNEDLFLDYADWDFCWRIQKTGKSCCITDVVILKHSLGQGKIKIGPMSFRVAAPIREYYQMRDSRYLLKQNYVPLKYKIRFLVNIYFRSIIHMYCFENGKERTEYIKRAKNDYKQRKHGEIESRNGN